MFRRLMLREIGLSPVPGLLLLSRLGVVELLEGKGGQELAQGEEVAVDIPTVGLP